MTVIYAGDLHGNLEAIKALDDRASQARAEAIVQVGDFGCLWLDGVDEYFKSRQSDIPWFTCGGNHENYDNWNQAPYISGSNMSRLLPNVYWVKRSTCKIIGGKNHLFLGGAESTDKQLRIEGETWWQQEMPTYQDLLTFSQALEDEKPEVVVTHDGPEFVLDWMEEDYGSNLSRDLQSILTHSSHKPDEWYFGHYHSFQAIKPQNDHRLPNTLFVCCGYDGEAWCNDTPIL